MSNRYLALTALLVAVPLVGGCVTREQRPAPLNTAAKSAVQLAETELLDVAIEVFDPNVPADEKQQEKLRVDPNVRAAEAGMMPVLLANTLQNTGYWGQVRVVPRGAAQLDVNVSGTIIESRGSRLKLAIKASDATNTVWLNKTYEGEPDTRSYKNGATTTRDPFQNVYVQIADDLAAARRKLPANRVATIQRTSQLRFDAEVAPYAYKDYIQKDRKGTLAVVRLPSGDSPLDQRLKQIRERDYSLLDTIDDSYRLASEKVSGSYTSWRKADNAEAEEEAELKRSARTRMLLGAVAVVGGAIAADQSTSTAEDVLAGVAVAGGIEAFRSGLGQRTEAKAHSETIKQQMASFGSEVTSLNVEAEGRVIELRGTAEQQYQEWRRLLRELYENDTGQAAGVAQSDGATSR